MVDLAVGSGHACVLHGDGGVSCWGANHSGQAGVAGSKQVPSPTRLDWLTEPVVALSAGGSFSCATLTSGSTTCWGKLRTRPRPPPVPHGGGGGYGVIGLGQVDPPVVVTKLPGPDGLAQHDGGHRFACGVRTTGSVVCWGHIPSDPAGYGFVEQPIGDATQVVAGDAHACALDRSGAVWCWRSNEQGQLGDGGAEDQQGPVRVVDLPPVTSLSAGAEHTCARTAKGDVWCWGARRHGAVGDGLDVGAARRPVKVEGLPRAARVDAGGAATCAVPADPDDHPWCWGGGRYAPRNEGAVVRVPLDDVVQATAGDRHTCARTADDTLWCWGAGDRRGDGTSTDGGIPGKVADGVIDVDAGKNHTCLVREDGTMACWGDGEFGQLDGHHEGVDRPVRVLGPPLVSLVAGAGATCGRDADGTAWCWGEGGARIGEPSRSGARLRPVPVDVLGPGALHLGADHGCSLHEGRLACVGEPWDGALGVPREEEALTPIDAPVDQLVDVDVRRARTCGIREDRTLWCWGGHDDDPPAQLLEGVRNVVVGPYSEGCAITDDEGHVACWGDLGPPFTEDGEVVETPMVLEGVDGIVELAMGMDHGCGRHRDGSVTCWGRWRGGEGYSRPWPARVPKKLPLSGIAQVVAGDNHTCARSEGGDVWCWGASEKGQVGTGSRERQPRPVQLELTGTIELAAGEDHTCARTADATWCWGDNNYGQLGHGVGGTDRPRPHPLAFPDDVAEVTAGYTASCATTRGKATWCWGRDVYRDVYSFEGEQPFTPPGVGLHDLTLGGADVGCALGDDHTLCWGEPLFGALGPDSAEGERLGRLDGAPRQVAIGDGHTCVLGTTGEVVCFGANHQGQCGVAEQDTVARHAVLEDAVSVAAGEHHTCAALRDGTVRCWGGGTHEARVVDGVDGATEVIAGWRHTCARTEAGKLLCWGADGHGQLGRGAPYERHRPWRLTRPSPTPPAPSR